jgi:hypothetical protein
MATNYKVLGQSNPAATTLTTLYTVPAATQTIISTITVANQAATAATYRIAVRVAAASIAAAQYLAYDVSLPANASDTLTLGVTVDATDIISVYASSTDISFNAFGSEIS